MKNLSMSVLPSSRATFLSSAAATRNGDNNNSDGEGFKKFFESWLVEQNQHLQALISASKQQENSSNNYDEQVRVVLEHYEQYYRAKSRWVKLDVLGMLNPSWRSTLEDSFLWIGGWRPSMAFHLLYSKSGLQLEAKLHELIRGLSSGDLGDLSPTQLTRVDDLQGVTVKEEKALSEKLAKYQETVADPSMVELSHVVTELMSTSDDRQDSNRRLMDDQVESNLVTKEAKLEEIFHMADDLRLKTLKAVIDVLTPIQAVHFLIAAAELHLRLHDWGKQRDARHLNVSGGTTSS